MESNFKTLGSFAPYEYDPWETILLDNCGDESAAIVLDNGGDEPAAIVLDNGGGDEPAAIVLDNGGDESAAMSHPMPMLTPSSAATVSHPMPMLAPSSAAIVSPPIPMLTPELLGDENDYDEEMKIRKGQWTPGEDSKLSASVALYGQGHWNSLAPLAGLNRSGKSCRLRWLNYLSPELRHDKFTPEEQLNIIQLHCCLGNRWSKIAEHLPGRTDNQIKNFWRTRVQKLAKHLNCDINSPQFNHALLHTWMPRLLEKMDPDPILAQSSFMGPLNYVGLGNGPMESYYNWACYGYPDGSTGLLSEPSQYLNPSQAQLSVNFHQPNNNVSNDYNWDAQSPNNL